MQFTRRLVMLVVLAITVLAISITAIVASIPSNEEPGYEIPPLPNETFEHHTAYVRFVVSNYRTTDVLLEVKVDGSTKYSSTLPAYGTISNTTLVSWVDQKSSADHSHDVTINAFYDGQDHAQTFKIYPQGPNTMPTTFEHSIT